MNNELVDSVQYRVKVNLSISCGVNQCMRLRLCKQMSIEKAAAIRRVIYYGIF